MRAALLLATCMFACGSPAEPPPARPAAVGWRARARALELGAGVPRDYAAAATLYRAACDDGRGDLDACGAWERAQLLVRGATLDQVALEAFAARVCVARRDPFSCVLADMLGTERDLRPDVMAAVKQAVAAMPACDAAHPGACWASFLASGLALSQGSTAEAAQERFDHQLCATDFVAACAGLVKRSADRYRDDVADAGARLVAACDRGDADACADAPGRAPVADRALCDARDYEACGRTGCLGDAAAAAAAAAHGITAVDCDKLRRRASQPSPDQIVATTTAIRDRACACADPACGSAAADELNRWVASWNDAMERATQDQQDAVTRLIHEAIACATQQPHAP